MAPSTRRASPFLHVDPDRIYDPVTGRVLTPPDPLFVPLRDAAAGEAVDPRAADALARDGWLVVDDEVRELSHRFRLRIVSLETAAACNQKCWFCPVSIAPRADETMPDALFAQIVAGLARHRETLEGVFLQSYNEPTIEPRFVAHCRALFAAELPVAVLTNASGLTPAKADALIAAGRLRYLAVNLSTLDADRYARDRGHDHLALVLRNLDHVAEKPLAAEMAIVVLGAGDDVHRRDFEAIRSRFAGTRFDVRHHLVTDRAGLLSIGVAPPGPVASSSGARLAGCDNLGSRPFEHLHVTPRGACVLCCQDYDERYVVGDLATASLEDVLGGAELARMRRRAYGIDPAPDDFICRRCVFARTAPLG